MTLLGYNHSRLIISAIKQHCYKREGLRLYCKCHRFDREGINLRTFVGHLRWDHFQHLRQESNTSTAFVRFHIGDAGIKKELLQEAGLCD